MLSNPFETIEWIDPDETEPADCHYLLFVPGEIVFPGYFEDGVFYWDNGIQPTNRVEAYAELPKGPKRNDEADE